MTWSTGSIAARAYELIDSVPTAISGTVMQDMAEIAIRDVENHTGKTIGTTGIADEYQSVLTYLTASMTTMRMFGIGADMDYKLGRFDVKKGSRENPNAGQAAFFLSMAQKSLGNLGRKMNMGKALG